MVRGLLFASPFLIAFLTLPAQGLASTRGSALLLIGSTSIDDDSRTQGGLDLSGGAAGWPVLVVAYAARSFETLACLECSSAKETMTEIGIGARGVGKVGRIQLSLGAGPAWAKQEVNVVNSEFGPPHSEWSGNGWWAGGLALLRVGDHLDFGGGVRYSGMDMANYGSLEVWTVHAALGWSWPSLPE